MGFDDLQVFRRLIEDSGVRLGSKDHNLTELASELKSGKNLTPFINGDIILKKRGASLCCDVVLVIPALKGYEDEERSLTPEQVVALKSRVILDALQKRFPVVYPGASAFKETLTSELGSKQALLNVKVPCYMLTLTLGREYGRCKFDCHE